MGALQYAGDRDASVHGHDQHVAPDRGRDADCRGPAASSDDAANGGVCVWEL